MGCDYYTPTHAYLISIRLCFTYAVREFHFHINNTALDQQLTQSAGCLLRASGLLHTARGPPAATEVKGPLSRDCSSRQRRARGTSSTLGTRRV